MLNYAWLSLIILMISLGGIVLTLVLYPGIMALLAWRRPRQLTASAAANSLYPSVSVLIVARNAEALLETKIANTLALNYPRNQLQVVVFSDGSTDETPGIITRFSEQGVQGLISELHVGKFEGLTQGAAACKGEIMVFSDADALLAPDALQYLLQWFVDSRVGGVCGQRVIGKDVVALSQPQDRYIHFDSLIKLGENRLGRITSNDGKLYAIRRTLFQPVPPGVTDDLFQALAVIRQGAKFLFEPRARALIRTPSRNVSHELTRRRRIVSRSLRAIWVNRQVLNPRRYGVFAVGLFINKVLRRLLPLLLLILLLATLDLVWVDSRFWLLLGPQLAGYGLAMLHPLLAERVALPCKLGRMSAMAWYFVVGNWGTLLGVWDFLRGRQLVKWDPQKGTA